MHEEIEGVETEQEMVLEEELPVTYAKGHPKTCPRSRLTLPFFYCRESKMSGEIGDDKAERVYGGCEGPDAMYVKLISSDGHEFIVKREHALTSGTIKAMLSGPGQFAENEANEVNFREIP